jgi:Lactoylglutathione lyase and related lyases
MQHRQAKTAGVDHVGLSVSHLERSRRFFVECLGWEVVGGKPDYPAVFVSDGSTRLTLWEVDRSGGYVSFDRRKNVGLHHIALKAPDVTALQELFSHVSSWPGVEVEFAPEPALGGSRMHCMVREPGGVRVEFVCAAVG